MVKPIFGDLTDNRDEESGLQACYGKARFEWPETVNTMVLTEEEGRTTVISTLLYPSKEARDAAMATGMKEGATLSYDRLAEYLRTLD